MDDLQITTRKGRGRRKLLSIWDFKESPGARKRVEPHNPVGLTDAAGWLSKRLEGNGGDGGPWATRARP